MDPLKSEVRLSTWEEKASSAFPDDASKLQQDIHLGFIYKTT